MNALSVLILSCSFLYHGSQTDHIDILEPRKRYTPGKIENSPCAIYASDDPAFAAAHAFPWSSLEGIDLYYDDSEDLAEHVVLEVPKSLEPRLNEPIFIYTVDSKNFELLPIPPYRHNYRTLESTKCIAKQRFQTVRDAIHHFGGVVRIKD